MKHILKNTVRLTIISVLITLTYSCEKHDFIDEQVFTGDVGPQAYWEVESSAMKAGSKMPFELQYYSTVSEIDRAEVWYNLVETESKSVTCPWVTSFTYTIKSEQSEEKRISQFIQSYPHSQAVWNDTLRAYKLDGEFPVSGTLAPFSWTKPKEFDPNKMEEYFGQGFMQHFKDSLFTLMKFADFKKMYLGMGLLDDFIQYTDSTHDENSDTWVFHFPKQADETTPVPEDLIKLYNTIDFSKLIENPTTGDYEVEYKKTNKINAVIRVYDVRGVYGLATPSKEIEIN